MRLQPLLDLTQFQQEYRIESWPLGILIFVMAVLGAFSFTSVLQGFFLTKNRWYEVPLLLAAALIFFNPSIVPSLLNITFDYKYFFYMVGIVIFAGIAIEQRLRIKRNKETG